MAGRLGPWSRYLLPPAEMWIVYAETLANGANIWYGIYDSNRDDKRMDTVREINSFAMENAHYLTGTKPVSKIGLVWSSKNADFYQSTFDFEDFAGEVKNLSSKTKSDARKAFNSWYEVMTRSHRLFDVIDDYRLEKEELSGYELIILPNIACMGHAEAEKLAEYVRNGGHVISTYDTACYNEYGEWRDEPLLKEMLGVESVDGTEEMPYDHVEVEINRYTRGIEQPLIPAPNLYLKVKPAACSDAIMNFREKQASRYCSLPVKTQYPFLLLNKPGKGTSVLFTGNIDTAYEEYRIPEHYTIMKNAIDELSTREIYADDDLTSLDINVRIKNNAYIIHLINHTSYSGRPISRVIPLRDVKLSVHMEVEPKSVRALRSKNELQFVCKDGFVEVTIPEIFEYEIVVAE